MEKTDATEATFDHAAALRRFAASRANCGAHHAAIINDAADEIERLTKEMYDLECATGVASIEGQPAPQRVMVDRDEIERLRAEITKLKSKDCAHYWIHEAEKSTCVKCGRIDP
jgi:ribosomal protein L19E